MNLRDHAEKIQIMAQNEIPALDDLMYILLGILAEYDPWVSVAEALPDHSGVGVLWHTRGGYFMGPIVNERALAMGGDRWMKIPRAGGCE